MGEDVAMENDDGVLETPDRAKNVQIVASVSEFEDSPVFNFLNNLSPIKSEKSAFISQTMNPLNFAPLSLAFTSPPLSSLRESGVLRRHQLPDPSKPEFASKDEDSDGAKQSDAGEEESHKDRESPFAVDFSEGPTCNAATETENETVSNSSNVVPCENGMDQNKVATSCDWDRLINNALMFESPNDMDPKSSYYANLQNEMQGIRSLCSVVSNEPLGDDNEPNNPEEMDNNQHISGLYRGMRRRCLVFEPGVARKKQFTGHDFSNERALPHHHMLPGIGLHLNALAATPKDHKISTAARVLIGPGSSVNIHSLTENAIVPMESEDASPKKKRRRGEQMAGDGEGCKRCNCKKSKCLKLYCDCFAAGVYCMDLCACVDCFNKPVHEDTVLATRKQIESRNPLAFAPKVIRGSDHQQLEIGVDSAKTPASARHKRGCNCKKSGCLKKYCECYQGGVGCSLNCRCEGCKNAFGRKDVLNPKADPEEDDEANIESAIPATPQQPAKGRFLDHRDMEIPGFLKESSSSLSLSPNGKRVSPPLPNGGLRSSRKLILQAIPSAK